MKVVRLSTLRTGLLYPPGHVPGCQGHNAARKIESMIMIFRLCVYCDNTEIKISNCITYVRVCVFCLYTVFYIQRMAYFRAETCSCGLVFYNKKVFCLTDIYWYLWILISWFLLQNCGGVTRIFLLYILYMKLECYSVHVWGVDFRNKKCSTLRLQPSVV
jgi:hypothetical protein